MVRHLDIYQDAPVSAVLVVGTYLGVQSWERAELRCTVRVVSLGSSIGLHLSTAARQGGGAGRGDGSEERGVGHYSGEG